MNEPLVSVIIPVYNHARYVKQCLNSLLTEGWPNLEVLVIDDGSSDNSAEVVQKWREEHPDNFVRFEFHRQENQGLPKTLNRLVGMSKGEYITLTASDDYLLPGGIATRVALLFSHPQWLAIIGNAWIINVEGSVLNQSGTLDFLKRPRWVLDYPQTLRRELLTRWWVPGPTLLSRRETYNLHVGIGLYDESISFEDRDFYLRLIARDALGFVSYPVAAYRVNLERLAAPPPEKLLQDEIRSDLKNLRYFSPVERFILWLRLNRTRVKLAHRKPSWQTRFNLLAVNIFWALVRLYHWIYIMLIRLLSQPADYENPLT